MTKKIMTLVSALLLSSAFGTLAQAAQFNGNLCETDISTLCLGLQGESRRAVVHCLRRQMSELSSDCREVMSDRNFKPLNDSDRSDTSESDTE
jgi:hypothetical protein